MTCIVHDLALPESILLMLLLPLAVHCPMLTGAENLVTVEFRTTISHIPNHVVLKPLQWVQSLQNGSLSVVDFAWSFSSWEHDGLGRYGDPLDPWGDIKAMQRASCYVKPGGCLQLRLIHAP